MKNKDLMINDFWNIIKECLLKYLLKRNYHLTFSDRVEKFNLYEENAHEKKEMKKEECIELKTINRTFTSHIKLFYNVREYILFIGKSFFDAQEYSKLQERESANLSQISHPFLPKFFGTFNHSQNNTIAIEFISGCTLSDFIKPEVEYEKRMKIIIEIMLVLEYLHDHKFIYRDLKPNNVMIDSNDTVVLIDFDRMIRSDIEITGTYTFSLYTAPDEIYTIKSDIYSLGLTIFFIMTGGYPPKKGTNESEFNFEVIPEEFKKIKDICYKCTKTNPESRPSITKLIVEFYIDYHEFFNKELFNSILIPLSKSENPRSQCELGILHYEGKNIQKDDRKAFQLLCLSANHNYPKAQHYLGRMYYEGNEYFVKNTSIAYQYFSLSSSKYPQSKENCELIEQNFKTIDVSFQNLPSKIQSRIDNFENPILKKIYSSFQFHYLSLYEVYSSQDNLFEQIIADYLLNTLKEFKLITYELYHNSAFFSSRNIFMNHIHKIMKLKSKINLKT